MRELLPHLLQDDSKHLRKAWTVYVLNLLRDKYHVNVNAISQNNGISRQLMYSYIRGTNIPSHDNFANLFYDIVDLYEPLLEFELSNDNDTIIEFLQNLE